MTNLDREALHQTLEDESLISVLDSIRGQSAVELEAEITKLGEQVRRSADVELAEDFRTPLDANDRVVGYLALLYEAENGTRIETELNRRVTPTER